MDLRRFEAPGIAHYAYPICDGSEGALVDPCRDVQPYLNAARELGVQLRSILETHRQEDFVMGSAELARRSGAKIVNGRHKLFGHGDLRLKDGETIGRWGARGKLTLPMLVNRSRGRLAAIMAPLMAVLLLALEILPHR